MLSNEKLVEILTKASEAYYNTDKKIISDERFDELEREYQRRFGKKFIGANPPINKGTINVEHDYETLVGTLSKNNTIEQFMEWYTKCINKISHHDNTSLLVTLKYDGNSVVLTYDENGKVSKALTRGKNGKGLDLTKVFKEYHELEYLKDCGIKYEVIMKFDNFERLMEEEGISYANPRSIVAGKLDCDDAIKYVPYFELVPLWLKFKDRDITRLEEINLLKEEFGTDYNELVGKYSTHIIKGDYNYIKEQVTEVYEYVISIRESLPFMIDGIVIEFVDEEIRKELGMNTGYPNWATALKFPYMEKESKVVKFDYCLGDSGRITPRVWFEEVEFNGTKHNKQSLQNYDRLNKLNLRVGSDILVQFRNDCLTYIEKLDTENNRILDNTEQEEIYCPECGTKAVPNDTGAFVFCPNDDCPGKILGKLQNFLIKMDIKGIKKNMLAAMKDAGLVNNIEDLYTMDYSKISNIERMGDKVAKNIENAIQTKVPYDYEILSAIGITNCSLLTSKDICKTYPLEELIELNKNELLLKLLEVEGISDITANYIVEGIEKNKDTIKFLLKRKYLKFNSGKQTNNSEIIVFTGFRDKDLQKRLEAKGYEFKGSVSKKVTLLVANDINSTSSNIQKAKNYNIRIISKEDFIKEFDN